MPLSTKQMEYLALAWQCFDTEPKIDYVKFAQVAGLASANSARELMRVTKKKLREEYGALSGSMQSGNNNHNHASPSKTKTKTSTTSKPTTPGKRSRAKKAAAEMNDNGTDSEDDDDEEESPTKKMKKTGGVGNARSSVARTPRKTPDAVKAEMVGDEEGEDEMGMPV